MRVIALDTLKYTKKLISAGLPQQQDEVQAEAIAEITVDQLATKYDLKELEVNLTKKVDESRNELMTKLGRLIITSISIATAILGILISIHH